MSARTIQNFSKVEIKASRKWKDPETGRLRQQSKTFMQTINPFNKNSKGLVKSREEILVELHRERDEWLNS
ncbi:hypothetical protein [Comamonas sp. C24C]